MDGDSSGKTLPSRVWLYHMIAVAAACVLLIRLWIAIPLFSPTTDEPCHIGAAVAMAEAGKAIATVSHPPLTRWVMAATLWHDGARLPECRGITVVGKEDLGYRLGTQVLYRSGLSFRTLLNHVREAMLIFPLLSVFYLYRLGQWVADEAVACGAAVFFSVDPTLLGHGFWACSDVAACAGFLAGLYYGYRWIDRPTPGRAAVAGLAVGLATAAKFSCLFVIPSLVVVGLVLRSKDIARWRAAAAQVLIAGVVCAFALWGTYCFNIGTLGNQNVFGHPPQWERLPHWFLSIPIPMPSFFLGVGRVAVQNHLGLRSYLNGQVRSGGWWYYFPELLLIKSPVGFLAALVLAIGVRGFACRSNGPRIAIVLVPFLVVAFVCVTAKYDLGVRFILPAIALLYLFTALQLCRGRWAAPLCVLMLIAATETGWAHPDYLSFFNMAVGGSAKGERYALDSNLDWNQDLYRLADYIHAHPGCEPYSLRLTGERNGPLLAAIGLDPRALSQPVHGSVLFISKNARLMNNALPWLRHHQAIAAVGRTIDVYDLRGPKIESEPPDTPGPDEPVRRAD